MQEPVAPTVGQFLGNEDQPQPSPLVAPPMKRRRGCGLVGTIIVLAMLAGVAGAVYGVLKTRDKIEKALDQSDNNGLVETLSDDDREALALTGGEQTLFEGGAPGALAGTLDAAIVGEPTQFQDLVLYPHYAFATAQNPTLLDHFDSYGWRGGTVSAPTPERNDAEAANFLFSIDQVNWPALSALISGAVTLTEVEEGVVTHASISRNTFGSNTGIVIRVYVTGPRSSAFIEADANGTVINIF